VRLPLAALLLLAAVACGGEGTASSRPSPLSGRLTTGEAMVELTGDEEIEFAALLDPEAPNIFQPPDGGFALNWVNESSQGFGVGGPLFTGSRETDEELSVSITIVREDLPVVFSSFDGECVVGIDTVDRAEISGTFECAGLRAGGATIDAEGDFEAGRS
jgi:hypothetical protein